MQIREVVVRCTDMMTIRLPDQACYNWVPIYRPIDIVSDIKNKLRLWKIVKSQVKNLITAALLTKITCGLHG